ncbi:MAG: 2-dehydropantoate 2-reductase [Chlorobi bacterium]|nr:2-dehydropantoate 2-reductase [Chlorobiota bacterium]
MKQTGEKILITGAGAIGGITAAFLARAGYNVVLTTKYPDLAKKVTKQGMHISGVKGNFIQKIPAVASIQELQGKFKKVFIATKANDMARAAEDVMPFLDDDASVISLQNGICEDELGRIVGRNKVVGCVVGWGATMHKPGFLEMTSTGEFVIGNPDGQMTPELDSIADMLNEIVPVVKTGNIYGHLYSKLIINSCITTVGAISGLTLGKLLSKRKVRNIFIGIMREGMAVAEAMNINVEPYAGKLDYYGFLKNPGFRGRLYRHSFISLLGIKYRRLKSSSLQSLERGRPTEINFLNGYISSKGKELGIPTPINDSLISMVKQIEEKKRVIQPENLNEIILT